MEAPASIGAGLAPEKSAHVHPRVSVESRQPIALPQPDEFDGDNEAALSSVDVDDTHVRQTSVSTPYLLLLTCNVFG